MGAVAGLVGAGLSAVGSIQQGAAAAAEARYQAQVARNNAIIAKQNAIYATVTGSREEEAYRLKASSVQATQRANAAASGIDVNVGSPRKVLVGAKRIANLDAATIRNNAWREAWNYRSQARAFRAESQLQTARASNAMTAGLIGAAGSVVGGIGNLSVSPKWASWRSETPYQPVSYGPSAISAPMAVPIVGPQPGLSSPMVPRYNSSPAFGAAGARS